MEEIRLRVMYTARLADAVHVLHVFQKKTQRTARADLELARARFAKLMQERNSP